MLLGDFTAGQWLVLVQHELLLFAGIFFAVGLADELLVDAIYIVRRLLGRAGALTVDEIDLEKSRLAGPVAVFVPAWQEADVIAATLDHMLEVWRHGDLRVYVGCYANDAATIASVAHAARRDIRIRLVVHEAEGPTSKADCLNRLYRALCIDEQRRASEAHFVLMHDAEDMVDPAALPLIDRALFACDYVQLPVMALPQRSSPLIAGHYSDEFAESHTRTMAVRDGLGTTIPGAGVGFAVARRALARLGPEPFARQSLTEDYELGYRLSRLGCKGRFLRARTLDGRLIATRAYFPTSLAEAVRQKTRWMHGIALQGWDRLGWHGSGTEKWLQLRDRRGPLAALLLLIAYALVLLSLFVWVAQGLDLIAPPPIGPLLEWLIAFNTVGMLWRVALRVVFTTREYGWRQGLLAVPRMVVSNVISIMAGRRALVAYVRTLRGAPVVWDKTAHHDHPALVLAPEGRP